MEVVSTSNLVSSETEKTTTACNFLYDYVMRGPIGSHAYMQIWSYSWKLFHNSRNVKKAPQESHIHKTAKWKSTSNKLKEEICFILILFLFYSHYSSEQKKVHKYSISWETWFFLNFFGESPKKGRLDSLQI